MQSRFFWNQLNRKVNELDNLFIMDKVPKFLYEGSRFYVTYYICPCCEERLLYKTNTIGNFTVISNLESTPVTSVFTCSHCRAFYAAKPNTKLADGNGFKIEGLTDDSYIDLLKDIESVGIIG